MTTRPFLASTGNATVLRVERGCRHLHRLGPRATAEFLLEVAARIGGLPAIVGTLAEFESRLTPPMMRVTGGDRFVARTPHAVPADMMELAR